MTETCTCPHCPIHSDVSDDDHGYSIEQIMPVSDGWVTIWDDDAVRPIVCLALIECETHGNRYVAPLVAQDDELLDATQLDGYLGTVHEDDILDGSDDGSGDDDASH